MVKTSSSTNSHHPPRPQQNHNTVSKRKLFQHVGKQTSELISAEALQPLVLKRPRPSEKEYEKKSRPDPVGDHMTRILNSHPHFRFDPTSRGRKDGARKDSDEHFTLVPLLCTRNWRVLKRKVWQIRQTKPLSLALSIVGFVYEKAPNRENLLATLSRTMLLLGALVIAGLAMVAAVTHVALMWCGNELLLLSIQLSTILIDWKDLERHCPPKLIKLLSILLAIARWFDKHVFLRNRFAGREWNKEEFEFTDTMVAQSRHVQLWNMPPPCIKQAGNQLCLDSRYMVREEWSQSTSKHIVAINFTYLMLQEDYNRKRARRSTVFHQRNPSPLDGPLNAVSETQSEEDDYRSGFPADNNQTSATVGRHNIVGLTAPSSPSGGGGIELVRDSVRPQPQEPSLAMSPAGRHEYNRNNNNTLGNRYIMLAETATNEKSLDSPSSGSSAASVSSAVVADMNWVDISAKIGMRVLNSTHLQRVVASQEAAERIKNITDKFVASPREGGQTPTFDFAGPADIQSLISMAGLKRPAARRTPTRPVHSMWTSAAVAGALSDEENSAASPRNYSRNNHKDSNNSRPSSVVSSEGPPAPPSIIRTQRLQETSPMSMLQGADDAPLKLHSRSPVTIGNVNSLGTEVIRDASMLSHLESQSYELEHLVTYEFTLSTAGEDKAARSCLHPQRQPLAPGVKVAAPMFPHQPGLKRVGRSNYQLATVVSSKRVYVDPTGSRAASEDVGTTNCLSVTCKIDKSFLRNGEFAELTFRVMDEWSSRYMPKHSEVPIGACVATTYGAGVVVGWRVEDDCHVVRSLWQRRGNGAAHAYLNRSCIQGVLEASVGFEVQTKCGSGKVLGYVDAGRNFQNGRYIVTLQDDGVYKNCVVALNREDVHSCYGAQFRPVIEHIKEACDYQIMLDNYKAVVRQQQFYNDGDPNSNDHLWKFWTENLDVLWKSFLKAVEDDEFDFMSNFMTSIIEFLERLDRPPPSKASIEGGESGDSSSSLMERDDASYVTLSGQGSSMSDGQEDNDASIWILNDMLGGVFPAPQSRRSSAITADDERSQVSTHKRSEVIDAGEEESTDSYQHAFAVIRILMRTVSLARAASDGQPQFRLAMDLCHEFLMFLRTIIKVQQKNVSPQSLRIWRSSLEEIKSTFLPIKDRVEKVGRGIAQRMEQQGRKAKIRVMRFADSILADEAFFNGLCEGDWKNCLLRIEDSLVKATIIDPDSHVHLRKTAMFIYEHLVRMSSNETGAAERNNEKLAQLAKFIQLLAAPKRSLLKLLRKGDVLEVLERILVRVFCREEVASRMLTIHASNFHSLRHLRILKDLSVAGRLWIPLLDAADEEFSYVVSQMPENAKEFMCPLSSIFSLCVAQFHKISAGNSNKDWLDFLLEYDACRIIHELDTKLILALSSFSRDVKAMMAHVPYYPSIDDDILNLIDGVEIDKLLREASEAIDDADKLADFIREKASTAIERFVAYLPKLSIPVERRDLGDGWVLTCHGQDGGDLTLSDVKVKRENLVCQVMGGDALFLPIFGEDDADLSVDASAATLVSASDNSESTDRVEESILDHIREMILQAKRHGAWRVGIGGVGEQPTDKYVASVLGGLPITSVLSCGIDLWRNLEIDDDELLEIAIRDVSYQIQLHKELEEKKSADDGDAETPVDDLSWGRTSPIGMPSSLSGSDSVEENRNRFNPRVDPTVLLLEMKNLTLHLERFRFRIEKGEKRTIFDPVFEGCGAVSIDNVCILLRVECARERIGNVGSDSVAPVLILRELEVGIENVRLKVEDTGVDWLLNKAVKGFSENITNVVKTNLKEQIQEQTTAAIEQLNSYFVVNQDIFLNLLGISLDDLEEHIKWV
ncbi:expressed unknown protein [Seminavis robusta]|uniref:Uncharacterized protein n=1 Tax=Seminavis robusta TaxID=568900 RepID=A0A9N8DTW9_9STRA|nr:expressed unknown protein [Seminavis robusta]|eukprot:Sro246_g097870.1 n/a (1845) ;mRNA; r:71426-77281